MAVQAEAAAGARYRVRVPQHCRLWRDFSRDPWLPSRTDEPLAKWPLLLRSLALPVVLLTLMTYVIMPLLTKALRGWLYHRSDDVSWPSG